MMLPPLPFRSLMLVAAGVLTAAASAQDAQPGRRVTPIVEVVRAVGPAVVNVYQEVQEEVEIPFPWNRVLGPQKRARTSLGSGFFIDADGYILTNAHVIRSRNGRIQVHLHDGTEAEARLVNIDADNDLALLKIELAPDRAVSVVQLGTSSGLMVGETVIAIGNPLGNENTVTAGIVSSLFRQVQLSGRDAKQRRPPRHADFIQVDAPINRGNSGGPLLNIRGEVIGVNYAVAQGAEGIGFAIPVDRVRESLRTRLFNPRLQREVVAGLSVDRDANRRYVVVVRVEPGGPAERAGLQPGDSLVRMRGLPIRWEFDFGKALADTAPGDRVPCTVRRGAQTLETVLELRAAVSPVRAIRRLLGVHVTDHPAFLGAWVHEVDPNGPGAQLPLQPGDIIDGIGQNDIDDVGQLHTMLQQLSRDQDVMVHFFRGQRAYRAPIRLF